MLTVIAIIHITCRHAKLKTLLTGIAFQPVKQAEAVITSETKVYCTAQWYAIATLTMMPYYSLFIFAYPIKNVLYLGEDYIQIQ